MVSVKEGCVGYCFKFPSYFATCALRSRGTVYLIIDNYRNKSEWVPVRSKIILFSSNL